MSFPHVTLRLREIKIAIHELRLIPIIDIQEKIQNLKSINLLLREQNQLLLIRQKIMDARRNNKVSIPDFYSIFFTEYESERVA